MSNEYFDKSDMEKNKLMAVLAYLGILVVIPIIVEPNSKFVRHHANQGLILLIASFVYSVAMRISAVLLGWIPIIGPIILSLASLLGVVLVIFIILGIVNVIQGNAKELPIIGSYKILK